MINTAPYFSIVIPTYNRGRLIAKTIESILVQDFNNFEILVVDDGSTDDTEEVLRRFDDKRLHYFKKENGERGAARNFGSIRTKGKYLNFFDSDDLMYPTHLSAAKRLIENKNMPEFFHLGYDFKNEKGEVIKKIDNLTDSISREAIFDNFLSCNGIFVRRDISYKFPFEEDRELASAEDWELWIKLISRYNLCYSNEITTSVVVHDQRSLRSITTQKIINRDTLLIGCLRRDQKVLETFGNKFNRFIAERYTFFMLCLAEDRNRLEVVSWGIKAFKVYPLILFSRRFLSSVIKIIV